MNAPKPYIKVLYDGKNITADISRFLIALTYSDKSAGESDEVSITLEDKEGLWHNAWYPAKGSKLTVEIGRDIGPVLKCGRFIIDKIDFSGPPDVVTIGALAAGVTSAIRTKTSYAHEDKTLAQIVQTVAVKHGFTVSGDIADVRVSRVTQYQEADLSFLNRIAEEYGHVFSIRDNELIFTDRAKLEGRTASAIIKKTDVIAYSFSDKVAGVYTVGGVAYVNQQDNKVVASRIKDEAFSDDSLNLNISADNKQQAEIKAAAALSAANSNERVGNLTVPGSVYLVAGNSVEVQGFGRFNGKYYIITSSHTIDRSGWVVDLELRKHRSLNLKTIPTTGESFN